MAKQKQKPKILLWDIETGFNTVLAHQLFNKGPISYKGILEERYIICASWKWLGESEVFSTEVDSTDPRFDFFVIERLHNVLSKADAIVAHYGDNFDIKMFNTRCIYYGMKPIPPVIQIDTYKMAKKAFRFNCNRLDYLGRYLGVGKKIRTNEELWLKCYHGDPKAIDKMVHYNKQDVRLLEKVYLRMKPYVPARINHQLFDERSKCPDCGSGKINYHGYTYKHNTKYRRFQCVSCGAWGREKKC